MKLTTLIENHGDTLGCLNFEHGLSMLLEAGNRRILFDTGQTGSFVDNAGKLKADLSAVTDVVLSHGHYDHSGGLLRFLREECPGAKVYAGEGYFEKKYKLTETGYQYNGNPFRREELSVYDIHLISEDMTQLTEDIYLVKNFPYSNDFEFRNPKFFVKRDDFYEDHFDEEIALVIGEPEGLVVIVGCSHKGIVNITSEIQRKFGQPVIGIIGGTHLVGASQERMDRTIAALKEYPLEFLAVSHCTGDENMERLREEFGERFVVNMSGNVMVIGHM